MSVHVPVLCADLINLLSDSLQTRNPVLIDATVGAGGHACRFLETFTKLRVIGIDADTDMLNIAQTALRTFGERVTLYNMWFDEFFSEYDMSRKVDAILFDLGVAQWHYKKHERGFSFDSSSLPDMRLHTKLPRSAHDVLYQDNAETLAGIFETFGEERYARKIANAIVRARQRQKTLPCCELASIVRSQYPRKQRYRFPHPATRVFQALRIAVNAELTRLRDVLPTAMQALRSGGRLGVISFHSLEDRIVKRYFKSCSQRGQNMAIGNVDGDIQAIEITRKPLFASKEEIETNPSSRSARLRILERTCI